MKEQTKDNTTARPWKRIEDHGSYWILGNEQTDKGTIAIASITNWEKTETAKANAALIVRAVNRDHAFDALVEALKLVQKLMQDNNTVSPHALCSYNDEDTILDQINEALRLAKGE